MQQSIRIAFYTLGCKVNLYETEKLEKELIDLGYEVVPYTDMADFFVINTCTVTAIASQKSKKAIRRFKKENPNAKIIAMGCLIQQEESLKEQLGIDFCVGTKDRSKLIEYIKQTHTIPFNTPFKTEGVFHTRKLLKIQDGCNNFCSYCIIPYVRGREIFYKFDDIINEAKAIERPSEVVICGIHTSNYEYDGKDLLDLISEIANLDNVIRIRLSSLEPVHITKDWVVRAKAISKLCLSFHISLQSGCDSVLARMNRRYNFNEFYNAITNLRKYYNEPFISTDIIVGFPGETDEEFMNSFDNIKKCNFAKIHIFPYSVREGTKAGEGECGDFVSKNIIDIRKQELLEYASSLEEAYKRKFIGQEKYIIYEKNGGYTDNYIWVDKVEGVAGELVKVVLE